jgi:hypothetical protein
MPKTTPKKASATVGARSTAKKSTRAKASSPAKPRARKSAQSASQKRELVYAPDHASFWVNDGQILNSLVALKDALDKMETEVYRYHTTNDRNDFAQWVESVLCDAECAASLAKARTPKSAKTVVVRHLKLYSL